MNIDDFIDDGVSSLQSGELQKAKFFFQKAIEIDINHTGANNNLGIVYKELGDLEKAKNCFQKVINIDPSKEKAHNNLGIVFLQSGDLNNAKKSFEKAINIQSNYTNAYWNLHGLSSNIDEALILLNKIILIDKNFIKARIIKSVLEAYNGKFDEFNRLSSSTIANHPFMRSVKWFLSLKKLPQIFFNRWSFFDAMFEKSKKTRPFYEFGVWYGITFKYFIKTFKKGFGFDTFSGLPESWHHEEKGRYNSFGSIPKIDGGEFIVGKFEDTLPNFFSIKRELASVINFDADLYSSTLCALKNAKDVIDQDTILIFDEFLMSDKWEQDEFKALNEFCNSYGYVYDVIGVSFFSKQVAVKLKKN